MGKKPAGVLMFLLVILKVMGPAEARSDCICSSSSCSCFSVRSVPQDMPTTITRLTFNPSGRIKTILQSDFSQYRSLEKLYLDNIRILIIEGRAFYHQSNLERLDLSYNRLTHLRADMFTGLGKLKSLFLNHNYGIIFVQAGTFSPTSQLETLWLNHNRLRSLSPGMFTGLENLQQLRLNNNNISDIQAGTFNPMRRLGYLGLDHNKLKALRAGMFTGLGNYGLSLDNNEISDIQAGTFSPTPQLRNLWLYNNKLTSLRSDMFTGLGNLEYLALSYNEISDIQAGIFNSTPQLRRLDLNNNQIQTIPSNLLENLQQLTELKLDNNTITTFPFEDLSTLAKLSQLYLDDNQMTTLPSMAYDILSSISDVRIDNNPWQCDCRMVDFRLKMSGSYPFEDQITCSQPDNLNGLKLKDVSPEDLDMSNCENSRIVPVSGVSSPSKNAKPTPTLSLPALLGAVLGSVAGAALIIGGIVFTVRRCKGNQNTPPRNQNVIFDNTRYDKCAVITSEHGETEKM